MPPRWVRRLVLPPAVIGLTLLVITTLPILAIGAAAASPLLPGRWRPLRLLWFAITLLVLESLALLAGFGLWFASGFGRRFDTPRFRSAHYTLMRWYLRAVVETARWTFKLVIDEAETDRAVTDAVRTGTPAPLLVFSRHAGAGDSLLLVEAMLHNRLRPRIVLKDALQWAPALDMVLHRVPAAFVPPPGRRTVEPTEIIARLAADMGPGDALLLFPEGGNFTAGRRLRSIAKLEERGDHERAEQARRMRHVLAPRPGGALAAISAAPDADVLFVAHTGLEELSSPVDIWRGLPMDASVRARVWHEPADAIPATPAERTAWLDRWWLRIDAWIIAEVGQEAVPNAVVAAVDARHPEPPE